MRRRLTAAILVAVLTALVLAGLGTIVLARFGTARAGEEHLRSEVETAASLVRLGQTRTGQLDDGQLADLEAFACGPRPNVAERIRSLLCQPEGRPLRAAVQQLCTPRGFLRTITVPDAMDASRQALCREPGAPALDDVRRTWCGPLPPEVTAGRAPRPARQISVAVRAFCANIDSPQPGAPSAGVLADEPVDLVTVDEQGTVVSGTLPAGVTVADLHVDDLRQGLTVSGRAGRGAYAAAAVDPATAALQVVVAARADDPAAGLIPWFLLASAATLVLGVVVASRVSRSLVEPLHEATAVTARIAAGDLDARLPEAAPGTVRDDEVAQLSRAINAMAEALQASRSAERQFVLSVSHDLRTPLTSIRGYAEAIADGATGADDAAQVILAESRRLERLVSDLLALGLLESRQFTFRPVDVDLYDVTAESVDAVRREVEAAGLVLDVRPAGEEVPVVLDPDRFGQVMANLVENAVRYAAARVTVEVTRTGARARVVVADDGPGIAETDLPRVFERRYVGSPAPGRRRPGTGLGLAIAQEMVQAMGATISAGNDPAGGARLVIELPLREETPAAEPPTAGGEERSFPPDRF